MRLPKIDHAGLSIHSILHSVINACIRCNILLCYVLLKDVIFEKTKSLGVPMTDMMKTAIFYSTMILGLNVVVAAAIVGLA